MIEGEREIICDPIMERRSMISVESTMKIANKIEKSLPKANKSKEDSLCSRERNVDAWVGTLVLSIKWGKKERVGEKRKNYRDLFLMQLYRFQKDL
jgi:hypothetical protein